VQARGEKNRDFSKTDHLKEKGGKVSIGGVALKGLGPPLESFAALTQEGKNLVTLGRFGIEEKEGGKEITATRDDLKKPNYLELKENACLRITYKSPAKKKKNAGHRGCMREVLLLSARETFCPMRAL